MDFFPVIDAILSPAHLASWLEDKYGLGQVSCRVLKTNMNHTYAVSAAGSQYVLRIYSHRHRSCMQVEEELRLLRLLQEASFPASYPVADNNDALVNVLQAPEGMRYAVLFTFAEGDKVRFITGETSRIIGTLTGRLHRIWADGHTDRFSYTADTLMAWAAGQIARLFAHLTDEMQFIRSCTKNLRDAFGNPDLRRCVVHLDIWYDNLSIREDGSVTFYDFDNAGQGWAVLDIGYFCLQLFFIEEDKEAYEQKKAAFIQGYRTVTPVTDEELALIPHAGLAIWIYYLGLQSERFESFANLFLSANYVKMYLGRARTWLKYHSLTF